MTEVVMDRRNFLRTVLATPFLTPLLLASKTTKNDMELYLIGDEPQLFIGNLLEEMQKVCSSSVRSFSFLNAHPKTDGLKQNLYKKGWAHVSQPRQASLTLSYGHLNSKATPSFTLVKDGHILDMRNRDLFWLWKELNEHHEPSTCLTIVSLKKRRDDHISGSYVSVYMNGQKIDQISLKENVIQSFHSKRGTIILRVEEGKARVSESSCRHKICLYSPPISLAGERIICAPNHLLLEIKGIHSIDTSIG